MVVILYTTVCLGVIVLVQWLWKRREFYRLSWQLPGPFAWPFFGNFFDMTNHYEIDQFRNSAENIKVLDKFAIRHGALFRFWLGTSLYVVASDATDLENILHSPHTTDKDDSYRFFEESFATVGLFTIKSEKWKRHRKLITPSFNSLSVGLYVPIFNMRLKEFVKTLSSKVDCAPFNMRSAAISIFIQMILDTTIGYSIRPEDKEVYVQFLADGQLMASKRYFNPFYQIDWIWKLTKYQEKAAQSKTYRESLFEKGSDTSTGSLAMILLMLAMHPECQEKVYEELKANFLSKDMDITCDDLDKLTYTDMCMKEALRLFPTVPAVARKVTHEFQLRDFTIPAGTLIAIDIFNIHRSTKYWGDNADQYIPERFYAELVHPHAYMVFSHGPRNCIGYRYALVSVKLALVHLLLNYRFTTPLKMSDLNYYAEINIMCREKLMVRIHNRK